MTTPTRAALLVCCVIATALLSACASGGGSGSTMTLARVAQTAEPNVTPQMRQRMPAEVVLLVEVDESGRPGEVTIDSSTDPAFNEAAADAVARYAFEPATREGVPTRSRLRIPIRFGDGTPVSVVASRIQPTDTLMPVAPIGQTSAGNPFTEQAFTMNGGIREGQMAFVITMETENYQPQLTITDAGRHLVLRNRAGVVEFDGPVNNRSQWGPLTQEQRFILERMNQAVVLNNNE